MTECGVAIVLCAIAVVITRRINKRWNQKIQTVTVELEEAERQLDEITRARS